MTKSLNANDTVRWIADSVAICVGVYPRYLDGEHPGDVIDEIGLHALHLPCDVPRVPELHRHVHARDRRLPFAAAVAGSQRLEHPRVDEVLDDGLLRVEDPHGEDVGFGEQEGVVD